MAFAILPFPSGFASYNSSIAFIFLLLIWANDSFAYLAGKRWGKTPLSPTLSPKKTVEGIIGGALGSVVTSLIAVSIFDAVTYQEALMAAITVSIFGPMGDLFESKIKREAGVKDSGNWLPGHGGLLDRLDSLLWAAPAYYLIVRYFFT
jgi:phosphatidate cytidylyltransferase